MEDSIEVILQERDSMFLQPKKKNNLILTACTGALLTGVYSIWTMFALPGFRKIPINLKVPYLPSSKAQTMNVMTLLKGRSGRLADLGSGDGRLVLAASSVGFQCTGFEINSMLMVYARGKARWAGLSPCQATFVNKDFWKTDLSKFNNVTVFLAPGVMDVLGEKLLRELPEDACVVACRFPFPHWPHRSSAGTGLDHTWAYDIGTVRSSLGKH
ncbi:adenine nucleotide translocase lysine N-methyltransferase [Aplochiton taeniatus]